ncbi:MAG: hypothetical protein F8N36_12210 [Desulfovibrio sp.]|uniref:hypothetical protein n=1 Tax=Desulfovibrio sp. TaxID=885 RepID=UPI00135EA52A|nr:hypothetical protein [Desulfovibrio sp.]MTJ93612.1 hypothetical protein [Desulfovibrio sp.]
MNWKSSFFESLATAPNSSKQDDVDALLKRPRVMIEVILLPLPGRFREGRLGRHMRGQVVEKVRHRRRNLQ